MNLKAGNKRMEYMRNRINSLKLYLAISTAISCGLFIICIAFGLSYMSKTNESYEELTTLQNNYDSLSNNYAILSDYYERSATTIVELTDISTQLDEQNKNLVESNQEYYEELTELRSREELYDKYEYAIIDESEQRTDITYDQLVTLEDLVAESSVSDSDLILAIVMTESHGIENAQNPGSTAKGYGQLINGTSEFVYTDILGYDNWSADVALNGDINLEMVVAYVNYLYEYYDGDLYATIRSYRGLNNIDSYICRLNDYLSYNDKSVQLLSVQLQD